MTGRALIFLAAAGSAALLTGAFVFQALGYPPCHLCLLQRWPHLAALIVGALALWQGWRWLPWAGAAAAGLSGLIAIYHTGVERRWWAGPDSCTSQRVEGLTPEELLNHIMAAPLVRCDEPAWMLFGLSMASWNAILSFALVAVWVAAARRTA